MEFFYDVNTNFLKELIKEDDVTLDDCEPYHVTGCPQIYSTNDLKDKQSGNRFLSLTS